MTQPDLELQTALRAAVADLTDSAAAHKRLERYHRQAAQQARQAEQRLRDVCAQFGIEFVMEQPRG